MNNSILFGLRKLCNNSMTLLVIAILLPMPASAEFKQSAPSLVTLLRVHDVGGKFGRSNDKINVDVVIKLREHPTNYFGFKLRKDKHQLVHQGMLDLLRDAYNHNHRVVIDYEICTPAANKPCKNGIIRHLWLKK